MKFLTILLIFSLAFAAPLDGTCDRTEGESCMNHPDCSYCNVTMDVNLSYFETYALISIKVKSWEPAELPLILKVRKNSQDFSTKQLDLFSNEEKTIDVKMERDPKNITVIVEVRDRDIGTAWSYNKFTLPGLEKEGTTEILTPILGVFLFLGILFYGFKQVTKPKPKRFAPPPVFMPPPAPQAEEEIIIVSKKKKYYYKKD
ncbi:MAG: hypothetical protein GOU98_02310 [Candidatus Altiarchaeota archaeon]|nr:hypothetical protein [Candidatus Altiarchaeota archaeon]